VSGRLKALVQMDLECSHVHVPRPARMPAKCQRFGSSGTDAVESRIGCLIRIAAQQRGRWNQYYRLMDTQILVVRNP